jgi:4-hydroxybenzoate polyprenyltransferase
VRELIFAIRPRQWVKNVFVLAALVFSRQLLDVALLLRVGGGFLAFCAAASATYLFNDLVDIAHDREHPIKRERPLASGRMSPRLAQLACAALAIGAIGLAAALDLAFLGIILLYLTLNTLYSIWLKHVVILDVMIIASGFVLRVLAGTTLAGVAPSDWLILCTIMLSLFLGFSKRRSEVAVVGERAASHRRVLADYSVQFLDQMNSVACAGTIMSYALYTLSSETIERFGTRYLVATVPFVLYGVFRYLYLIHQRSLGGSPAHALMGDWPMRLNAVAWLLTVVLIVY